MLGAYTAVDPERVAAAPEKDQAAIEGIEAGSKKNALKTTAAFPVVMLFCYLLLILYFRSRGGYKAVELTSEST